MSVIRVSSITNLNQTSGPVISGVTTFTGNQGSVKLPSGSNAERVGIESGSLRYNNTSKLLEFYDGTEWRFIVPAHESANAIALHAKGWYTFANNDNPTTLAHDYFTITTTGNAQYFGDALDVINGNRGACSSNIRSVYGGGSFPPADTKTSNMEVFEFATKGNQRSYGSLTVSRKDVAACSSTTRGIFEGSINATPATSSVMDYITIAVNGNAISYANLSVLKQGLSGCASNTRGIFAGGEAGTTPNNLRIDFVTISTTGVNSTLFGSLNLQHSYFASFSSSTRGIFAGGYSNTITGYTDTIEYITIATTGNAQNFGNISQKLGGISGCSSVSRGVIIGGYDDKNNQTPTVGIIDTIQYVTISNLGNALYFGNLTSGSVTYGQMATSNNHGGLS